MLLNAIKIINIFGIFSECDAGREANPIMTFPIVKRINTELFIDGKHELYIHKRRMKNSWSNLLERDTNNWLRRQNMWE